MNKNTIPQALLILFTAASTEAVDLVNNLDFCAQSAGIRELAAGETVGVSFLTGETWFSADQITLEVQGLAEATSPLRVRLFEVVIPASGPTEQLSLVGEFELAGAGSVPQRVSYQPTGSIILAPQTQYALVVGYPAALEEVFLPSLTLCTSPEAGGEAGFSFTAEWCSIWEDGQDFWMRQDLLFPIRFQLAGTPVENRPPCIERAAPSVAVLWPPNGSMVPVKMLGVTDPDGDPVTIKVTRVEQNEPVGYEPDAIFAGDMLALRAERQPSGGGRVYVIHFQANDGKANGQVSGSVRVTVPLTPAAPVTVNATTVGYLDSTKTNLKWGKVR